MLRAALGTGPQLRVFGNDYPTPDGTCIRDYVHVDDLARAHALALRFMDNNPGAHAFNLGNGVGFSVLEVIAATSRITGREIAYEVVERRPGDPAVLVASSEKAKRLLSWQAGYVDIEEIIATAWRWHSAPRY